MEDPLRPVLSKIFLTYNISTGIELGIGDITQYLNDGLLWHTTMCRNTEFFYKWRVADEQWQTQFYQKTLDIDTYFQYYTPEYDLAVINSNDFDSGNTFFANCSNVKVPLIVSKWDLGPRRDYLRTSFEDDIFLYYRDMISEWIL